MWLVATIPDSADKKTYFGQGTSTGIVSSIFRQMGQVKLTLLQMRARDLRKLSSTPHSKLSNDFHHVSFTQT